MDRPRFLSSSQVGDWMSGTIAVPAKNPPLSIVSVWTGWEDSTSYGSGQTSIDTDAYSGVEVDDLIIVFTTIGGGATTPSISSSGLSFTEIAADATGGWDGCKAWYAWQPDSTQRAITMSYGSDRFMGMAVTVLRNVDPDTPLDVTGVGGTITSSSTPTVPGITTTTDGAWAFACAGLVDNYSPTGPSGWSTDVVQNTSDWSSIGLAHKEIAAAGTSGDAVFGASGSVGGHYVTFAVKPVPAPA